MIVRGLIINLYTFFCQDIGVGILLSFLYIFLLCRFNASRGDLFGAHRRGIPPPLQPPRGWVSPSWSSSMVFSPFPADYLQGKRNTRTKALPSTYFCVNYCISPHVSKLDIDRGLLPNCSCKTDSIKITSVKANSFFVPFTEMFFCCR